MAPLVAAIMIIVAIMTNPVRAAFRGRPGLASQESASQHPFADEVIAADINKPPAGVTQPTLRSAANRSPDERDPDRET